MTDKMQLFPKEKYWNMSDEDFQKEVSITGEEYDDMVTKNMIWNMLDEADLIIVREGKDYSIIPRKYYKE
jgi:hypothetical protein